MRSKNDSTFLPSTPSLEVALRRPVGSNHGLSAIRSAPESRNPTILSGAPRKSSAWRVGGVSRMIRRWRPSRAASKSRSEAMYSSTPARLPER
jgi:hypothetical protein